MTISLSAECDRYQALWRKLLDYIIDSDPYSHRLHDMDLVQKRRLQSKSECQSAGTWGAEVSIRMYIYKPGKLPHLTLDVKI